MTNKVEAREEAVSPSILLFLYNTNYYKIENDRYTKNEVQQNPKTLHRIDIINFRKEIIFEKIKTYYRYKKQNEKVVKSRVKQIETKVCDGYLDSGKAAHDRLHKILKKLGDQIKQNLTYSDIDFNESKFKIENNVDRSETDTVTSEENGLLQSQ